MAVQYELSEVRNELVEVSRLYEDGFLYLKGDPGLWIHSIPGGRLSAVRSLELYLWDYKGYKIGDSIGELSHLTHLCIGKGIHLKYLPNTISRLQNLHHLEVVSCWKLQELPANLGDLHSLTSLTLSYCSLLKSLPNTVAKLSNLTTLDLSGSSHLEELPANLGDMEFLSTLFLGDCDSLSSLPWSITKLSKLRFLYLPTRFRLETLPPHLNDSIIISVQKKQVRKNWKEIKTEMKDFFSIQFPIIPVELAEQASQKTPTPGYLRFMGDPRSWTQGNYGLHSSVKILDLELWDDEFQENIPDSIGEFPQLTHLYISNGCLYHLPLAFRRITHLSLICCTFQCDTESQFNSLGTLSTLISLHLEPSFTGQLPNHIDLPISLRHLTLCWLNSLPVTYMASIAKLCNLNTLILVDCGEMELLLSNLKLTKLVLKNSLITSLPLGLKHLEIIDDIEFCCQGSCDKLQLCFNQLVHLETFSCTCYAIESPERMTSLRSLRELQLKDCFNLKKLPPNLDELVKLCSLNVSGTRIKSLPDSIMKLHNLRHLILPKCFDLQSLPRDFESKVTISVDDTDESYYKHEGYYNSDFETSNEEDPIISDSETFDVEDPITSDSIGGVNEIVLAESRQEAIIESGSSCRPLNHHVPDDNQNFQDSHLNGGNNAVSENNSHAVFSIQNQENQIETSHTRDRDGMVTSINNIAVEPSSNVHETISCGENCQEAIRTERMDNVNLEPEQGIALCDSLDPVLGGRNSHALENRQDNNSQSGYVKRNTQKKEISLERITELMSQNVKLNDAAEKHLGVSRSTLKRALKKHKLTWPSSRKRKYPDTNRNETHHAKSSSGRNEPLVNSVDPSNPAGPGQGVEHFVGPNQHTLSVCIPPEPEPEPNVVNESNSDAVIRTVEEPPMSTQCRMDGHQRVEEHVNGAKECALANTEVNPNESCSTFDVKATYNQDTVRFYFSLSSSFEQLKEELGKRFELEVGKFKMYYQDDENDWILIVCISDVERALCFSKLSGSSVLRLSIKLK